MAKTRPETRPIRITHLTPRWFPHTGGMIFAIRELSEELARYGVSTAILTWNRYNKVSGSENQTKVYTVPSIFNVNFGPSSNPITVGLLPLLRKMQKKTDIFIGNSYIFEMTARASIYRRLGLLGKPYVLYFRGGLDPTLTCRLRSSVKIGKIVFDNTLGRLAFKFADHIVSVTRKDVESIHEMFSIPYSKISYIGTGIKVEKFFHKEETNERSRVTFIGRLVPEKGLFFFGRILATLPQNVDFFVIGDGPLRSVVLKLQKRFKHLKWIPNCTYQEIVENLSCTDVLINPSITEARSRVLMEAMAAKVPPVAFDVGTNNEIITRDTGFLIKPFDVEEFCEKVNYLITNDEHRKIMGEKARNRSEIEFGWKKVVERFVQVLKNYSGTCGCARE